MNRWLVRFAMSFFIIAAVLIWEAYKRSKVTGMDARVVLYLVAASASISLGVAGTREKHKRS